MKYSLRSLILFADADMSGLGVYLVMYAAVAVGFLLAAVGIIFGLRWFLIKHWPSLTSAKFTIREVLIMTAMVAVFLAWFVDHRRQAKEIEQLRGYVGEYLGSMTRVETPESQAPAPNPPKP